MTHHLISCPVVERDPFRAIEMNTVREVTHAPTFLCHAYALEAFTHEALREYNRGKSICDLIGCQTTLAVYENDGRLVMPPAFRCVMTPDQKAFPRLIAVGACICYADAIGREGWGELEEDLAIRIKEEERVGCPVISPLGERPVFVIPYSNNWVDPDHQEMMILPQPGALLLQKLPKQTSGCGRVLRQVSLSHFCALYHGVVSFPYDVVLPQTGRPSPLNLPDMTFFSKYGGTLNNYIRRVGWRATQQAEAHFTACNRR